MKSIRKLAFGVVLTAAGIVIGFLGNSSSTSAFAQVSPSRSRVATGTWGENAYCAKGDEWIGPTSDGPAQLPEACVYTAMDGSPSPGNVTVLASGGDVIAAVKAAHCGDTIQLQKGGSFTLPKGPVFPSNGCDPQHWITIRTSALDSVLPAEHARINPSYAGVASLPGRPQYTGPNQNVMAKLIITGNPILVGDHYRLIGLEITRPADGKWYNALVAFTASHIVLDRDWIHGDPTADTTHLVQTQAGADHVAVINSYMTDAHCIAGGVCTDAQDFSDAGHGVAMKAYNNFMEASGQSILFGGSIAAIITSDVEVRLNHMFKPLTWDPLDPNFIGKKFMVKNNFELKEGQRILVEGNVMENTWGGFTQKGANILLTPKNQVGSHGGNVCPICYVADVTVRYNYILHGSQGLQVANVASGNNGWSLGGYDYSIHDLVFDGMQYSECYQCAVFLNELGSGYQHKNPPPAREVMHDVSVTHITVANSGWLGGSGLSTGFMTLMGPPAHNPTATPQISNFDFTNSILDAGTSGAYPTGGGDDNCSVGQKTVAEEISACWVGGSSLTGNLFVTDYVRTNLGFPSGNFTTPSWTKVGFVNFNGGDGGDYHLLTTSPYHNAGTDGKDLGADIDTVNSAVSFAE